jgi:hypothetical protein
LSATGQKMLTVEAESDSKFIPKDICFLQFPLLKFFRH